MIPLEKLEGHLQHIAPGMWDKLFSLIPIIEACNHFGSIEEDMQIEEKYMVMPHWVSEDIVQTTFELIHELDLAPAFDWMDWKERYEVLDQLSNPQLHFSSAELCMMLTVIVQENRFHDGYLVKCFEEKKMEMILRRLKQNVKISLI